MSDIMQTGIAQLGIAIQSGKGVAASAPDYCFGVLGGGPKIEVSQDPDEVTSSQRLQTSGVRSKIAVSVEASAPTYVAALGAILLAAYGDVQESGPVGGAYTHIYTHGDAVPYVTLFWREDDEYQKFSDAKISELECKWEGPKRLEMSFTFQAGTADLKATPWSPPGADETDATAWIVPVGGSFKIDGEGATPATAQVTGGSFKVSNNLSERELSSAIVVADHDEGRQTYETSLTLIPDDLDIWREMVAGDPHGQAASDSVQYGSLEFNFKESDGGDATLKIEGGRVMFMADYPEAQPAGGRAELEAAGIPLYDGTNSPMKATLVNAIDTYIVEGGGS